MHLFRTCFMLDRARYQVSEKPPSGSPENAKTRHVAQGTAVIVDGRPMSHVVTGLAPGKVGATVFGGNVTAVLFSPKLL